MSTLSTVIIIVFILGMAGFSYLTLYTDQLGQITQIFESKLTEPIPLSLANSIMNGDLVCDLTINIPTLINNDALFETPRINIITDEEGIRLSGERITGFLDENEYLYISTENMDKITFQWSNCFNEGAKSLTPFIPLFNGQIASERISALSFQDASLTKPTTNQPLVATGVTVKQFTQGTKLILSITGTSLDNNLRLVDKNGFGEWVRIMDYDDGLNYPVTATLKYTIENVRVDDYQMSVGAKTKPINEMRMREVYNFNLCGVIQDLDNSLTAKTLC